MRIKSIDLMKFLAVLLVINSHMDLLYGKFHIFATGGSIGDGLFLFCSGYTLFFGNLPSFLIWYKRKIFRIYPSVVVCTLVGKVLFPQSVFSIFLLTGGEFIIAIMVYYALLYFVRRHFLHRLQLLFVAVLFFSLAIYVKWFPYKYEIGESGMYGTTTLFRWIPYFNFMVMGAWYGLQKKRGNVIRNGSSIKLFCLLLIFYILLLLFKMHREWAPFQIITIIPLLMLVSEIYLVSESRLASFAFSHKYVGTIISFIAGLCLESYLIQGKIISIDFSIPFPINALAAFAFIMLLSFVCRTFARGLVQKLKGEKLNWRELTRSK